jgi:hypothetical protein
MPSISRFIQENTMENGIPVLIAIRIHPILEFLPVQLHATHNRQQITNIRALMDIPITAQLV